MVAWMALPMSVPEKGPVAAFKIFLPYRVMPTEWLYPVCQLPIDHLKQVISLKKGGSVFSVYIFVDQSETSIVLTCLKGTLID